MLGSKRLKLIKYNVRSNILKKKVIFEAVQKLKRQMYDKACPTQFGLGTN